MGNVIIERFFRVWFRFYILAENGPLIGFRQRWIGLYLYNPSSIPIDF